MPLQFLWMIEIPEVERIVNQSPVLRATSQYAMASVSLDAISHATVELLFSFQGTSPVKRIAFY